jgi:hypothetical protein
MLFRYEGGQLIGWKRGMSRTEVRAFMSGVPFPYMKSKDSVSLTDAYYENTVQIYYDDRDIIRGVEIFRPNELFCDGFPVLGKRAITLLSSVFSSQAVSKEYGVGYVVGDGTVSLYVPEVDDDVEALVEAVYVKLWTA